MYPEFQTDGSAVTRVEPVKISSARNLGETGTAQPEEDVDGSSTPKNRRSNTFLALRVTRR